MKRGAVQKHHQMVFAFFAVLIAAIVILMVLILRGEPELVSPMDPFVSDYPPDWIERQGNVQHINVSEATQLRGDVRGGHQRYFEPSGDMTVLVFAGAYQGNFFNNIYKQDESVLFRIHNEPIPNDGIPEFFAVYTRKEGKPMLYMFVDDDWKLRSGSQLYVVWGSDLRDSAGLHEKTFDFSLQQNGVYIDYLDEDIDWIIDQNPVWGGVIVSQFDKSSIVDESFIEGTYVLVR
ncbi:MAG: hypothetical protein KJ709_05575 [Nanoarchaeota archaeon]|nr:hypothetical protein [Nanoarchaeota archaeon]